MPKRALAARRKGLAFPCLMMAGLTLEIEMSKAIQVKWLGPTHTKGSRIRAYAMDGHAVTVNRDYGLDNGPQEALAAYQLADKMDWPGIWIAGALPGGETAFVNIGRQAGQVESLTAYLETLPAGSWFEIVAKARPE